MKNSKGKLSNQDIVFVNAKEIGKIVQDFSMYFDEEQIYEYIAIVIKNNFDTLSSSKTGAKKLPIYLNDYLRALVLKDNKEICKIRDEVVDYCKNSFNINMTFNSFLKAIDNLTRIYSKVSSKDYDVEVDIINKILGIPVMNALFDKFVKSELIANQNKLLISKINENEKILNLFEIFCSSKNICIYDYYGEYDKSVATNALNDYMNSINHEVLTYEEERELAAKMAKGGKEGELARKELIEHNLRLVISIAKYYKNYGFDIMDLIQEGNIGLVKGIDRFDYTRETRVSTYVTWWIKQGIKRFMTVNGQSGLKVPFELKNLIRKIKKAEIEFFRINDYYPSNDEIAEFMGVELKDIEEALLVKRETLSLDMDMSNDGEDDGCKLKDIIPDEYDLEDDVEKRLLQDYVEKLFVDSHLPADLVDILKKRNGFYGRTYSLEELGRETGYTRERIRQKEASAYRKLRVYCATKIPVDEQKKKKTKTNSSKTVVYPSLIDVFPGYPSIEIVEAVKLLNEKERKIFDSVYTLNDISYYPNSNKVSKYEYKKFDEIVLPALKLILENIVQWNSMFVLYNLYISHTHNIQISPRFKTNDGYSYDKDGRPLGSWIETQMIKYKNGELLPSQINKFKLLGIILEDGTPTLHFENEYCEEKNKNCENDGIILMRVKKDGDK